MNKKPLKEFCSSIYIGLNVKNFREKFGISPKDSVDSVQTHGSETHYLISISNIDDDGFFNDRFKTFKLHDNREISRYLVGKGDLIISSRGTSLKTGVVEEDWKTHVLTSNMIGITLNDRMLSPELLEFYLRSEAGFFELLRVSSASKKSIKLTKENLGELMVPYLKEEKMKKVTNVLKDLRQIKRTARNIQDDLSSISEHIMKIIEG